MKVCNNCKKENDDNNIVCLFCGNVIADVPKMDFSEVVKKRQAESHDPLNHPERTIENMLSAKERKDKRMEELRQQMEGKTVEETPAVENEEEQGITKMEVDLDDIENNGNTNNNNRFFFDDNNGE